ncbi:hypothetical protein ABMA70_14650 [Halobacteriovorax sp. XZX-3]|uniref:hypothetical protein n=1 Tax=unclassified Halobacteriovorax TaxID=2639665 RepID=UPI000CD17ADF|nr:hypothetical protein [Halobacteriovorax sp. DA5]POB13670.1 hypothetical protein C0Z22_08945 [Halobacteriovorax sp. DA5]
MENKEELFHIRNENHAFDKQSEDINHPDFYLNDELLEELKLFCQNFDPYRDMDLETKFRLQEFGVLELSNPFEITNKLLLLLENNLQYRIKLEKEK